MCCPGEDAAYVYVCSNETVSGLRWPRLPECPPGVPLVVDMSSDIASGPIEWDRVGVIFACTPKNIGHPGLTVVVARRDLLDARAPQATCPGVLSWRLAREGRPLWQTPPTFNVYTTMLVCEWIEREGGVDEMAARAEAKSAAVYAAIDASGGWYETVSRPGNDARSLMNVPFKMNGGDAATTDRFLRAAFDENIVGLFTKTPFGDGEFLRASMYNHLGVADAETLAAFMARFQRETQAPN